MKLYTSYYGKLKACRAAGCICVRISYAKPCFMRYVIRDACPSDDLRKYGREHGLDDAYRRRYLTQLNENYDAIINRILKLNALYGDPIVFFCYEKDPLTCHRSIFADWLEEQGMGEVKEWSEQWK